MLCCLQFHSFSYGIMWHGGQAIPDDTKFCNCRLRIADRRMIFQQLILNSATPSAAYMSVNRVSIGSDNGLSPIQHLAINWTNTCPIGPLGTNFSEILIKIQNFSFTTMHLKISSVKRQPFCSGGRWVNPWMKLILFDKSRARGMIEYKDAILPVYYEFPLWRQDSTRPEKRFPL